MKTIKLTYLISFFLVIASCNGAGWGNQPDQKEEVSSAGKKHCDESSEWRDHNGPDNCSYYSDKESCSRILGKLNMISRLHKGTLEKGVFEGGLSSRWFEIKDKSIVYFKASGEIADKGQCDCKDGILKINWESGANLPEESRIYFRSADSVELRYYDYPFDFMALRYDSLKPKTNPTKILGVILRH